MEAVAAVRTLHSTVTAEEVTTHAETEAVALILAQELVGGDAGHPGNAGAVSVVVDHALGLVNVSDDGEPLAVSRVDHPLYLAGAVVGVVRHQESWLLCKKI